MTEQRPDNRTGSRPLGQPLLASRNEPVIDRTTLLFWWLLTVVAAGSLLFATWRVRQLASELAVAEGTPVSTSVARATVNSRLSGPTYLPQMGDTVYVSGDEAEVSLRWGPDAANGVSGTLLVGTPFTVEATFTDDDGQIWLQYRSSNRRQQGWLPAYRADIRPPSPDDLPPQDLSALQQGSVVVLLSNEKEILLMIEPSDESRGMTAVEPGTLAVISERGPQQGDRVWLMVQPLVEEYPGWIASDQVRLVTEE